MKEPNHFAFRVLHFRRFGVFCLVLIKKSAGTDYSVSKSTRGNIDFDIKFRRVNEAGSPSEIFNSETLIIQAYRKVGRTA
ncbi:MAG: hypothetical protein M3384_20335 [Acidobacteriota bacterium]|nr:hypothetical protein [Acidobacteriota bacterium]